MEVNAPDPAKVYQSPGMVKSQSAGTILPLQKEGDMRGLLVDRGVVGGDNGIWKSIPACEVFPGELLCLVGCDFLKWSCLDPLGEVVNND